MKRKNLDLYTLIVLLILAGILTVAFSVTKFVSIFLFFGLPCLYLIWRNRQIFKKSFTFAFLFSIPLSVFVDTLATLDGSWYVPHSIVPFRLFGVATFEVWLFGLLWVLFVILFYKHFFDHKKASDQFPKKFRKLLYLFAILITAVVITYILRPTLLVIPYFYNWFSLTFVVSPLILFLASRPKFLPRFALQGIYFFITLLIYELAALQVGLWSFPGHHFIGWVNIFGCRFPFEELVFYMIFATPSFLAYYEYFGDDKEL